MHREEDKRTEYSIPAQETMMQTDKIISSSLLILPRNRTFLLFLFFFSLSSTANAWSLQSTLLDYIKSSSILTSLHQEHIASPTVSHMMKSTPLVNAPDASKLEFADSFMGQIVANIMAKEQELLGDWKIEKIVEAAGDAFDEESSHENLMQILSTGPKVTLFSFVDCPWCLLAKRLLQEEYYLGSSDKIQIIELEHLGQEGKELRASIALATGRTSMPACFINGKSVGGYTDGFSSTTSLDDGGEETRIENNSEGFTFVPKPDRNLRMMESKGLASMHETGKLRRFLSES